MVVHDGSIWLFGGSNGKMTLNDLWRYQPKEGKWSKVESNSNPEVILSLLREEEDTQ